MARIQLDRVGKRFIGKGRHRRPLYREVMSWVRRGGGERFDALSDVSLTLEGGDRVALVGPNGAGKTTLLRTLAGIYHPTSGVRRASGRVACFFETGAGIAPVLPIRDNIRLYGALLGLGRRQLEEREETILEFSELSDQRWTRVEHLSTGTQQRLFFAVMLETLELGAADIFLFDELLGGADFRFKEKAEARLESLQRPDPVVVYAGHDMGALRRLCDRGIYVNAGRVREVGPVDDVIATYEAECGPPSS